jgi:hypothetical protein
MLTTFCRPKLIKVCVRAFVYLIVFRVKDRRVLTTSTSFVAWVKGTRTCVFWSCVSVRDCAQRDGGSVLSDTALDWQGGT